jgi:hypothetical protein
VLLLGLLSINRSMTRPPSPGVDLASIDGPTGM